ncbi:MAG: FecR domain-containing protein [Verrucomicrobia bacterium]|nr:FecR domain-containing protein [Verrucomicrobiota bacterium]
MNSSESSSAPPAVRDAAARWAVRLEGEVLSAKERRALDAWLAADPTHRAQLSRYCQFSTDLERQLPVLVAEGAADVEREVAAVARSWWRRSLPVAAFAAAAAAVAWMVWPRVQVREVVTAPAHRQTIALADGTRADLNARTSLKVDFSDTQRRLVQLDRGEALFQVAKNPARPFIVVTPGGRVRVTGTTFNVRTDPAGRLEVAVLEGSVEVQPLAGAAATEPLKLAAGDQVTLDRASLEVQRGQPAATAQVAAWRDGWVVFERAPLGEVLRRFSEFHGREIAVAPDIAGERISGRFGLDDLDGFLFSDLERALPAVRVERTAGGSVRVQRR